MNTIEVWEPRYHDRVVLVAKRKVVDGENRIKITRGAYAGDYFFTGDEISSCPVGTNGKIDCYEVPLVWFPL